MISTLTEQIPTVSLAEMTERAQLMTRVDRKYLLSRTQAATLLEEIGHKMRIMEIDGQRIFQYRTNYYDTDTMDSFYDAAFARRKKFKVRAREYCDSAQMFFEVKTASGKDLTLKDRISLAAPEIGVPYLNADQTAFAEEILALRLGISPDLSTLNNSLTSEYSRMTFLIPQTDERMTLDLNLMVSDPAGQAISLPNQIIVETKSRSGRSDIDRHLWQHKIRPLRISKYATGLALLNDELPRNRWTNTIKKLEFERCAA